MLIIYPGRAGPPNPAGPHSTAVAATTVVTPLSLHTTSRLQFSSYQKLSKRCVGRIHRRRRVDEICRQLALFCVSSNKKVANVFCFVYYKENGGAHWNHVYFENNQQIIYTYIYRVYPIRSYVKPLIRKPIRVLSQEDANKLMKKHGKMSNRKELPFNSVDRQPQLAFENAENNIEAANRNFGHKNGENSSENRFELPDSVKYEKLYEGDKRFG